MTWFVFTSLNKAEYDWSGTCPIAWANVIAAAATSAPHPAAAIGMDEEKVAGDPTVIVLMADLFHVLF